MKKIVFTILLITNSLYAQEFCFDYTRDASLDFWKDTVNSDKLKKWIEEQQQNQTKTCIKLTDALEIAEAKAVAADCPTEAFYIK